MREEAGGGVEGGGGEGLGGERGGFGVIQEADVFIGGGLAVVDLCGVEGLVSAGVP